MKNQIERAEPSRGAPYAAHTPGPWQVDTSLTNDKVEQYHVGTAEQHIAAIRRELGLKNAEANARLIAQAPTLLAENEKLRAGHVVLLEALRHLRDRVRVVVEWPDHEDLMVEFAQELVEAEAAIQQAERT